MLRTYLFLFSLAILLGSCARPASQSLIGQWQGQDESGNAIRITFTDQGEYLLWVNQQPLIGSAENQPLQFSIKTRKKQRMEVHLFEDNSSSFHATLQADFKLYDFARRLGEEKSRIARQNAENGDHDEQFDQRKRLA